MATRSTGFQITARDLEVLTAFDAVPLTADQMLTFSHTFDQPFTQLRLVQRRLQILSRAGLMQNFPYAVASNGRSPHYYKLTRSGYAPIHPLYPDGANRERSYLDAVTDIVTRAIAEDSGAISDLQSIDDFDHPYFYDLPFALAKPSRMDDVVSNALRKLAFFDRAPNDVRLEAMKVLRNRFVGRLSGKVRYLLQGYQRRECGQFQR